ncbi:hypothetical protein LIQ62_11720, partial [Veillonella ratti]
LGYGTSTTSETGFYSSMQEKDTQQLCRMSFLKVHRLFSTPKFDKEPVRCHKQATKKDAQLSVF